MQRVFVIGASVITLAALGLLLAEATGVAPTNWLGTALLLGNIVCMWVGVLIGRRIYRDRLATENRPLSWAGIDSSPNIRWVRGTESMPYDHGGVLPAFAQHLVRLDDTECVQRWDSFECVRHDAVHERHHTDGTADTTRHEGET